MTRKTIRYAALFLLPAIVASTANAQKQPTLKQAAPSIKLVQPGADRFYKDLDYVLGLTTAKEQKQLPIIKEYIDLFLIGVDRARPFRIDVLTDAKLIRYLVFIPIDELKKFRNKNLDDVGIGSKKLSKTFYRLVWEDDDSKDFLGFMRIANNYAAISSKRGDLPSKIADPRPPIVDLVKKYDLALDILNKQTSAAAMQLRRQAFDTNIHPELLKLVKQLKSESDDDYQLRKLFTDIQLDELRRIYVEAKHARLGLVIDESGAKGSWMDIALDPLPDTDLSASVGLLAKKPSAFANIARTENSILSGRINHPLDKLRITNFLRLSKLIRSQTRKNVGTLTDATQQEKENRKIAADLFFDMVDAEIKSGVFDGFVEAHPNQSRNNTIVGGILAVDGNQLIEVLKLFPKESQGQKMELNVDEMGDVKIHKFTTATKEHALFNGFLGSNVIYLGTSKEAVWYAGGENALDELKAAIQQTAQPNTGEASDSPVDFLVKLGPWTKLRQAYLTGENEGKEILKLRQLTVDAFSVGDDTLTLKLDRVENRIEGLMTGQPGILRFVGKILADFSSENLDDSKD